jgi:hypothetical protein
MVAVTGGGYGGQMLRTALVEQGGRWKLDQLEGFVGFDREAFLESTRAALTSPPDPLPEEAADCFIANIDELGDERIEAIFLGGDRALLTPLITPCE